IARRVRMVGRGSPLRRRDPQWGHVSAKGNDMKRLSGLDAAFLALETEQWPTHVVNVTVFDPSECPDGYSIDALKQTLKERLHLLPPLRWRAIEPPLGLGRPHWIEDPDFDLDWHIRRIALPAPGGRKELADLPAEIYPHRLDRRRPL